MDETAAFYKLKELCAADNLLQSEPNAQGDDVSSGICDDGTLMYNLTEPHERYRNGLTQSP